ncbi:MAG: hypothetical protein C4311_08845 [Chloroflexota bacterium]
MKARGLIWRCVFILAVVGLGFPVGMVGRAEASLDEAVTATEPGRTEDAAVAPYTYARVIGYASVYRSPEDAASGRGPIRGVGGGYVWVSLGREPVVVEHNGEIWVQINPGEYVRTRSISIYQPSTFQGVVLTEQPAQPFGWILRPVQPSPAPGAAPHPDAPTLPRYTLVTIYDAKNVGGALWDQIGPDQWIRHVVVGQVSVSPRPAGVGPNEKWIEINLYEQTLAAYEGDRMVYATLVSSGLPQWSTPRGLTRIWWKLRAAKISGAQGRADYYFLEDVPWIMYFNRAVALHGAYWHDRFGYVHSHGCVNLAPRDARWLFDWTTPSVPDDQNAVKPTEDDPGTWVWVH